MQEQFQYPIAKSPKEAKMEIKYIYPQSHKSCNKHNVFFYKREPDIKIFKPRFSELNS
jgi:hypothetical protein